MLYIGAAFCPCSAELRWSMPVALSRLGMVITPLRGISTEASPRSAATNWQRGRTAREGSTSTPPTPDQ
jgi:hypothetical protein